MKYLLTVLLAGCTTASPSKMLAPQMDRKCDAPEILSQQSVDEVDREHAVHAQRGCIKFYGEGACLVKLIKKGERNYYAICRRQKGVRQ
jgi:hypothetical protein